MKHSRAKKVTRSVFTFLILSAVLFSTGCRRQAAEKVDEEGHVIVENKTQAQVGAEDMHRQMLEEMKSFDQSVEAWMADSQTQPQNQAIKVEDLKPHLKGRLAKAIQGGQLMDPTGNAYVILALSPDSNIRITVSQATASKPEFKDAAWGDYAPR
jgi:hypothetical protein